MGKNGIGTPLLLALGAVALSDCAPNATVTSSQVEIPVVAPGTARVWFLRGWDAPSGQGYVYAAAPIVFANGASVGDIPVGCEPALCRRWSKKAKLIVKDGKVYPWEPSQP